jgi:uncharacterized coiled-coil protein SlyX
MPTQEERLSALEKFEKVAAAHIRETEENTTILLGVIREQGRDIKRMVQHLETIDERLETIDGRLDTLERDMESRFGTLELRFEAQDKKLDQMLHLLTTLTAKPGQEA